MPFQNSFRICHLASWLIQVSIYLSFPTFYDGFMGLSLAPTISTPAPATGLESSFDSSSHPLQEFWNFYLSYLRMTVVYVGNQGDFH